MTRCHFRCLISLYCGRAPVSDVTHSWLPQIITQCFTLPDGVCEAMWAHWVYVTASMHFWCRVIACARMCACLDRVNDRLCLTQCTDDPTSVQQRVWLEGVSSDNPATASLVHHSTHTQEELTGLRWREESYWQSGCYTWVVQRERIFKCHLKQLRLYYATWVLF